MPLGSVTEAPVSEKQAKIRSIDDVVSVEIRRTHALGACAPVGQHEPQVRTTNFTVVVEVSGLGGVAEEHGRDRECAGNLTRFFRSAGKPSFRTKKRIPN